jgi:hypothetical protein
MSVDPLDVFAFQLLSNHGCSVATRAHSSVAL